MFYIMYLTSELHLGTLDIEEQKDHAFVNTGPISTDEPSQVFAHAVTGPSLNSQCSALDADTAV